MGDSVTAFFPGKGLKSNTLKLESHFRIGQGCLTHLHHHLAQSGHNKILTRFVAPIPFWEESILSEGNRKTFKVKEKENALHQLICD